MSLTGKKSQALFGAVKPKGGLFQENFFCLPKPKTASAPLLGAGLAFRSHPSEQRF